MEKKASDLVQDLEKENESLKYKLHQYRWMLFRLHLKETQIDTREFSKEEISEIEKYEPAINSKKIEFIKLKTFERWAL